MLINILRNVGISVQILTVERKEEARGIEDSQDGKGQYDVGGLSVKNEAATPSGEISDTVYENCQKCGHGAYGVELGTTTVARPIIVAVT